MEDNAQVEMKHLSHFFVSYVVYQKNTPMFGRTFVRLGHAEKPPTFCAAQIEAHIRASPKSKNCSILNYHAISVEEFAANTQAEGSHDPQH